MLLKLWGKLISKLQANYNLENEWEKLRQSSSEKTSGRSATGRVRGHIECQRIMPLRRHELSSDTILLQRQQLKRPGASVEEETEEVSLVDTDQEQEFQRQLKDEQATGSGKRSSR
ncbi:uncharacterized protein PGTG_16616 [Puccinia graminis f. sp. tritici CRL 75-36-700-3]|uniref:Uncharacterized protein n=1 Tax=Puccinia graminis f. sp. tritici (strain CRL 75-36-700-3 / race SCCL) TaxID=418459 RepID=E3L215_PUCGT|nr:uncharacterized protein PGTG_16616 [Puccinia graminis f. sp. tritici CRL 75-36-700-3]EFP90590.2 hypothetical protein PGTG_16616 [Puccinia graminis f. sp. tritici CRL 75-36-700-3]